MIMKQRMALFCASILVATVLNVSLLAAEDVTDHSLVQKAEKMGGSIRVIVRLKMDYAPEMELASSSAVDVQHSRIATLQNTILSTLDSDGVDNIRTFTTIPFMAMNVDTDALRSLLQNNAVANVEEDIPVPPTLSESVPFINADKAHLRRIGGKNVTVAILDTGVRKTHTFFGSDKVVSEACYSTNNGSFGSTTICPNGLSTQIGSGAGVNCTSTIDECSHGTHLAGIAAGKNGFPGDGVAPEASIIAIQIFSKFDNSDVCGTSNPCVRSWNSDQIAGLERVYTLRDTYNIAAVNLSLGTGKYENYCDTVNSWTAARKAVIDNLRAAGIATVIASGNDGYDGAINAPACISSAIAVGATLDFTDKIPSYSNYSSIVDLMAPGSSITSSVSDNNTTYRTYSGSSMAAAHVTGALALVKERYPDWTVDQLETWLKTNGRPVSRAGVTRPRINLSEIEAWPATGEVNMAPIQLLLVRDHSD